MELIRKNNFKKSLRNILARYPHLEDKILDMLDDFCEKLYESSYFRKKFMIGNHEICELQFGGDWRCLCEVEIIADKIYLLNIGSHSSLELSSRKRVRL